MLRAAILTGWLRRPRRSEGSRMSDSPKGQRSDRRNSRAGYTPPDLQLRVPPAVDALMLSIPPLPADERQWRRWVPPPGAGLALALCAAAAAADAPLVMVTADSSGALALEQDLAVFAGELPVLALPDWETLPYELFSPHGEIVAQRIGTLSRLPGLRKGVLVIPAATLMQRLAPRTYLAGSGLQLQTNQALNLEEETRRLEAGGYRRVPQVGDPGEFAVRGAVLDIYPSGSPSPYRIELLDDVIESLRSFDVDTQRSMDTLDRVNLLPAREFPLTEEAIRAFRARMRERFAIDVRHCPVYQDLSEGTTPAGIEYYLPLFFGQTETLFDYLAAKSVFVLDDGAIASAERFWQQTGERHAQREHDVTRPILSPEELFLPPQFLREALNRSRRVELVPSPDRDHAHDLGLAAAPVINMTAHAASTHALNTLLEQATTQTVLLAADSPGRREMLREVLATSGRIPVHVDSWNALLALHDRARAAGDLPQLAIGVAPLSAGFVLPGSGIVVLSEQELSGERVRQERTRRRAAARDPETVLRDLTELAIGDPIVHVDHGVGRYQGLVTLDVGGSSGEFLALEYAKGDRLYVPVAQLGLVSRYSGTSPESAPLHSLAGDAWERAKRKAAEKARDAAAELLAIHAQRAARGGLELRADPSLYARFAATFRFEETADQQSAIDAVLADLASPKPMDRVICGDVGFGKTEVALRAAFVAAMAGRQVAVLVPTTLLAQQHWQNFRDRMADWPIRIEALTRFQSRAETPAILGRLATGDTDIVIGTHRLLQGDVKFARLGLVIVDEEHRFGVRHKEQLKRLRAEVDLLTLTATPIPRTLNMALMGMRDLSIIATPPSQRLAVKTVITAWDAALIREAFQRELARGGQVYFLHNEVDSIDRIAREIGELVPEARIRIAHGQMPERELEKVMLDFHRQRFNTLVCTTIIESGIDIPTANTILVNRADKFGLAQLHQLRGRVGRSHHRAYAYLIVPERSALTSDAEKRLDALASLEELGAGFTLATHDMEIRGAGELLGEEQSGQIEAIGFTLYAELLERAVRALREGKIPDYSLSAEHDAEIELHTSLLIPEDYLPDVHARLTLYKRIASAPTAASLRDLQVEMIDRFGLLPEPTRNLFGAAELKLAAGTLGIRKIELGEHGGRVQFQPQPPIEPLRIIHLIQRDPGIYRLDGQDRLRITENLPDVSSRFEFARNFLARLGSARD